MRYSALLVSALFVWSTVLSASAATGTTVPVKPAPKTATTVKKPQVTPPAPAKKPEPKKLETKKVEVKKPETKPVTPTVKKDEKKPTTPAVAKRYITGPKGGCYYLNQKGAKVYVDHSYCKK